MNIRMGCWVRSAVLAGLGLSGVASADVVYVDATGNGDFLTVQAAIDAAFDGNVILVRSGSYPGFTVDQLRLLILEDVGATAKVSGTVTIRNISPNGLVLLSGLEISALDAQVPAATALNISNCAGHVRVQDCVLRGGESTMGFPAAPPGGKGCQVLGSLRVSFASVEMRGGNGYGFPVFGPDGGPGGPALETSGSALALYDCSLTGGAGGEADYAVPTDGGRGGDGARVLDHGLLASGCSFKGGPGGGTSLTPGNGGDGLHVALGAQAQLVDNTYVGGQGGWGYGGAFGAPGLPQSGGGVFNALGGVRRKFRTPALAAESGVTQLEVAGEAGDQVWLLSSGRPGFVYMPSLAGINLIAFPVAMSIVPLGILPASGSASFALPTSDVAGASDARRTFLQGLVQSVGGAQFLGSPMHQVVLNCSVLQPDCNGNAQCDSCDLLRATSIDCDANGIPDDCEPDCNANGITDACDIAAGTSLDQNHNGIPDECDPQLSTWYVDDSAAAGGNGSAGAPFQTLAQAFGIAISADTILVADGLYVGASNRNLSFGGREIVVQSLGGAANCTIDCQALGRAFKLDGGVGASARIEGFTIKNGKTQSVGDASGGAVLLQQSDASLVACRFENNQASSGGAVYADRGSPLLRNCAFVGNSAPTSYGGAVSLGLTASPGIVDCVFDSNTAARGGALSVGGQGPLRIERCAFLNNVATTSGGVLHATTMIVEIDQCLMAGNRAASGAAIRSYQCNLRLIQSTIVDNVASNQAGAVYIEPVFSGPTVSCIVRNSVLWGNTSPGGEQFKALFGTLDLDSCSLQNGAASVVVRGTGILSYGIHNQSLPPQFVDPDGADNDPATVGDNDYRLALSSPCIDAGNNAEVELDWFDLDGDGIVNEFVPFDFDGLPRQVDVPSAPNTGLGAPPLVDLGAWERQP